MNTQNEDYVRLKKEYDADGMSKKQTSMIKAMRLLITRSYAPLASLDLVKNLALFTRLFMFREYEVVVWAAMNDEKVIK